MTTSSNVPIAPANELPLDAYYDAGSGRYLIQDMYGTWIRINAADLKMRLRAKGLSPKNSNGCLVSPVERIVQRIQHEKSVVYAGPVAGHMAGPTLMCGQLVLVTQSPFVIETLGGKWDTIRYVLENLFRDDKHDQVTYFKSWLKHGLICLRSGIFQPGQAVVLAGPAGCGKSFMQSLITLIFGGRTAKPYRYLTGDSIFNRELLGAEHLTIEDEVPKTDIRSRRELGAFIKNTIVNRTQSCHGKFMDAVTLMPFWRLTISVNEEPENLQIVPPLDESLDDKIMLFKCKAFDWPMSMNTPREQEAFWDQIVSELPAFLTHLIYEFEVPTEISNPRYGVRRFQHPDLLEVLDEMAPETRMLNIIDEVIFDDDRPAKWIGTADELRARLEDSHLRHDVERLLGHYTAVGVNLARLASKRSNRVKKQPRSGNRRAWEIYSHHFETGEPKNYEVKPVVNEKASFGDSRIRLN